MSVSGVRFHLDHDDEVDHIAYGGAMPPQEEQQAVQRAQQQAEANGGAADPSALPQAKRLSAHASSGASDYSEFEDEDAAMQLAHECEMASRIAPAPLTPSPYPSAGWASRLTYHWLSPFMSVGARKTLEEKDLHSLMPLDQSRPLMDQLAAAGELVRQEQEAKWQAAKEAAEAAAPPPADGSPSPSPPSSSLPPRPRINIWRMLWLQFGRQWCLVQLVLFVYTAMKILQPLMLFRLVEFVQDEDEPAWHGYLYAIAMGLGALGQAFCHHQYFFHAARVGIDVRIALNGMIYKKALTLRSAHLLKTTTGQIVNLVSNDSARTEETFIFVPFLWNCPLECAIVLGLLYEQVGVAAFAGFGACLMLTPMQLYFSKLFTRYRRYTVTRTDARVKTVNEVLVGADVVKMMGWENSLEEKVQRMRADEFGSISNTAMLKATNQGIFFLSMPIITLVTFFTMHFRGIEFTAANVFTTISLFNVIKFPLTNFIPWSVEKLSDCNIAFARIRRFLELDDEVARDQEKHAGKLRAVQEHNERMKAQAEKEPEKYAPGSIHMEKASFVWELTEEMDPATTDSAGAKQAEGDVGPQPPSQSITPRLPSPSINEVPPAPFSAAFGSSSSSAPAPAPPAVSGADIASSSPAAPAPLPLFSSLHSSQRQGLQSLDLHIKPGTLVGVIGSIGSYKSSLLAAILGEMTQTSGGMCVGGSVAYASQVSWIFAASVRDNILFGRPFDARRYAATIRSCCLVEDLAQMPQGDLTEIGEKGVNLSGGQRARLSCARAVYAECDTYILDDPLAALDAVVARKLFEAVLSDEHGGLLAGKTRILVTHQVHLLTDAHVVVLEHGRIAAQGTFDELVQLGLLTEGQRHAQADNDSEVAGGDDPKAKLQKQKSLVREARRARRKERGPAHQRGVSTLPTAPGPPPPVASSAAASATSNHIVLAESSKVGQLDASVFFRLFEAGGGKLLFLGLAMLMAAGQAAAIVSDKWLADWSGRDPVDQQDRWQAWGYLGLVLGTMVLGLLRSRLFFQFILRAASVLHGAMVHAVIYSPLRFFEANPSGRILNRFTKDQSIVDELLPLTFFDFIQCAAMVLGCLVAVGMAAPYVLLLLVPIIPLFMWVRRHYLCTSREIKRLDATTRSPVYAHFSATLAGLMVIRAFNTQKAFVDTFVEKVDANTRAFMLFQLTARWFGLRLDVIAASLVACLSLLLVGTRGTISPSNAAFALSYCLQLTALFQWAVRQSAEVETMMTSVERIVEYGQLPAEGQLVNPDYRPPEGWPEKGAIEFRDVRMRYRPGLDLVLRGVDLSISPCEKVGVCGRTGAGKSSLFQTLLRLVERDESSGPLLIDGVDTGRLGLRDLRTGLSIIPQYPVIFSGSLRYNLDPFGTLSEEALWGALEAVQLRGMVSGLRGGLDANVAEFGSNFSVGECQLLCVARALLKHSKILLIDEATANVDSKTDALIQAVIRERFADRTVLTIAHRLNTIVDGDKIVVMAAGKVAETGTPAELLARPPADVANDPTATVGLFSFMARAKRAAA